MITAYFKDEGGNTLVIDAKTFQEAYNQAVAQDFYVYDYDTEEWGDETSN
jgi:hypothetical protein